MFSKIQTFLSSILQQDAKIPAYNDDTIAIACLLCEVSNADHEIRAEEVDAIESTLCKLLRIDKCKAKELLLIAKESIKSANSLFEFTSKLRSLDRQSRINLITAMWEVAFADGHLDPIEEAIIRKVAKLIYVEHSAFIRTKLAVTAL
jgi:uncharacterized tellurite resistance protein B-like protein